MTLTNSLHTSPEQRRKKEQRIKGDLDYFGFISFKSQHHLSNLMLDDFVEIWANKKHASKTISCGFHYLMHDQSAKWTRTQIITSREGGKKSSNIY